MTFIPNNRQFKEDVEFFLPKYNGDREMAAFITHVGYQSLGVDTSERLADYIKRYQYDYENEHMNAADERLKLQDQIKRGHFDTVMTSTQ